MVTKILIALAVIFVAFLILVAMQSPTFSISRQAKIAAPADVVFAQVNDLHNWEAWSPWAKRDLEMKQSYEGASSGAGAVYSWNGNKEVGEGRTTITESHPHDRVRLKLEFFRPFPCTNDVMFTFEPEGDETLVTWSMSGTKNLMAKAVHLFMDMDKMVGGDFEQGLASLKSIAESTPQL